MKSKRSVISLAMEDIDNGVELITEADINPTDLILKEDELGPVIENTEVTLATDKLLMAIENFELLTQCDNLVKDTSLDESNRNVIMSVADSINPTIEVGNVATEGFVDKIKEAAKKVYDFIVELIKKFITYIKNIFNAIARYSTRIEGYEKQIKELTDDVYRGTAKLLSNKAPIGFFSDGGAPTKISEYIKEINYTNKIIGNAPNAIKDLVVIISKIINHVENTINQNTVWSSKIKQTMDQLEIALDAGWNNDILKRLEVTTELNKDTGEYRGATLLGGAFIKSIAPPPIEHDSDSAFPLSDFVKHLKQFKIEIVKDNNLKSRNLDKECTIPTKDEMLEICSLSKNTVTISEYLHRVNDDTNVKTFNKLAKVSKLLMMLKADMPQGYFEQRNVNVSILLPISRLIVSLSNIVTPVLIDTLRGVIFVLETSLKEYEHSNTADPSALKLSHSK